MSEQVLVPFRFTPEEKEKLFSQARTAGMSANEFVRSLVRGTSVPATAAAPSMPTTTDPVPTPPSGHETWDSFVVRSAPIPTQSLPSRFHWSWEAEADWAVRAGYHLLLIAPHGVGKSFWAMNRCHEDQKDFYMITCGVGVSRETLEGQFLPRPGAAAGRVELIPYDGIVTSAVSRPARLLVEEFTMMPPDTSSRLLTALNSHLGAFDVPYRAGQVQVHEEFRMIATANPPRGEYLGTERLNAALLSRWYVMELGYPSIAELLNFATSVGLRFPANKPLCELAAASWQKFVAGEWDSFVSPREIVLFAKGLKAKPPSEKTLFYGTVANKFAQGRSIEEQQQVRAAVWDLYDGLLRKTSE